MSYAALLRSFGTEITVLDQIRPEKDTSLSKDLSCYILKIARLGGYLAQTSDPPPGN